MSPLFLVLVTIVFAVSPTPILTPMRLEARLLAVVLGQLTVYAAAVWLARWASGWSESWHANKGVRRFHRLRLAHDLFAMVVFLVTCQATGWLYLATHLPFVSGWTSLTHLIVLAPHLVTQWFCLRVLEPVDWKMQSWRPSHADGRAISDRRFTWFLFRTKFGVWLATSMILSFFRDILGKLSPDWEGSGWQVGLSVAASFFLAMALAPVVLRWVWPTHRLPASPLREAMVKMSRATRFRFGEILVWDTFGTILNAAISGVIPRLRYVFLSDGLLRDMPPMETLAVYGHEVGHARRRHLIFFFLYAIFSMALLTVLSPLVRVGLGEWLGRYELYLWIDATVPLEIWLMAGYFFVTFGPLSRLCEREADLFGSRFVAVAALWFGARDDSAEPGKALASAGSCFADAPPTDRTPDLGEGVAIFSSALQRVADLNGMSAKKWTWRHGSIHGRIQFLKSFAGNPERAAQFDRQAKRIRQLSLGAVLVSCVTLFYLQGGDFTQFLE